MGQQTTELAHQAAWASVRPRTRQQPARESPGPSPRLEMNERSDAPSGDEALYGISCRATKWVVSFARQRVGYTRTFAFSTHGGKEAARAHAIAWRDSQLAAHPPMTMEQRARNLRPDNTSGYPGVRCCNDEHGLPGRWIACTYIGQAKPLLKSFSIKKYGHDVAKAMAIAERERQLQQVEGFLIHNPEGLIDPMFAPAPYPAAHLVPKKPRSLTPGVYINPGHGGKPVAWIAETHRREYSSRKSFSIAKHGNARAKELALAERERQLAEAGSRRSDE